MRRLIAGIDPGAMVGWAVLDLEGNLVGTGSGKGLDLGKTVALLTGQGKVIVVGSDKAKIPSFVQECATKLGARAVGPKEDLRILEKRKLTKDFAFANHHEMDALSGAFIAFKHFQILLRKIRTHLRQAKKEALFERVAEVVIKKEISISSAVEEVEKPVVLRKPVKLEKPIKPILAEVSRLQEKLASARIDNAMLKKQLEQALESVRVVQKRYQDLKSKTALLVKPKKPEARIREKESRIKLLGRKDTTLSKELERTKKAVRVLEKALARIDNRVAVKKLARLGWDDVQKQKDFLFEGDVLLVDDPNQYSDRAVTWLKERGIDVILCKKPVSSRVAELLPFAFLPADLEIEEFEHVALVDKEQLAKLRRSKQFLKKLVEKYREERTSK